ncbi:kelch domain-containing protein 10 homolog isoform X1 [Neodiprion virginianus]|uniref:Kelch domain-containing protein 10 homolog isoform X1 n=1 Tax=Neodiprion lecontei TaxID=441921 RepID=A0A6J0BEY6_NEOLC|nr:kelch domain-containing protein 10 homolog isoform X1 [Neodiprion lecontei]XP_046427807.1 kelch domain-containing protein 10 homolog isoform X1 [Neodiprion fabricii]XP_046621856.1 kelch domain-containing protein 10 homolog isoform X1 [Neodiprion virginianus]
MYAFKPFAFTKHEPRSAERPKARSGHRIACDELNLYSYGGFNPCISNDDPDMRDDLTWVESKPLFKELWKFNLVTQEWRRLPCQENMPNELASNAVILKGDKLLIYGGTGVPFGYNCSNHLYICDVKNGKMQMVPARGHFPLAQYGQALVCHGSYLYTVGGTTGYNYTCDIHRFELRKAVWEHVYICAGRDQSEPRGRYRHELAFDGNKIYVLGGGTALEAFGFLEIPAFDLATNKWMTLLTQRDSNYNSVPAPRRCHGSVQYTDERTGVTSVVISGGYDGTYVFSDVWRLDLNNLQWNCLRKCVLPNPVYFHSAALTPEGCMYTFGGIIKKDDEGTRTDAVHSVWLIIPKLSVICWQALNYYNRNLKYYPPDELLHIGVPAKFVQRIEHDAS